jgi:predicted Ser/Thr protein kinase
MLDGIHEKIQKDFDSNQRIFSYEEYLGYFKDHVSEQTRGSAQYVLAMMDSFGTQEIVNLTGKNLRFRLFDIPADTLTPKIVAQESAQNQIYRCLKTFAQQGFNHQLLLLHGPNGSAKSSLVHALMGGMERYSKDPAGAVYSFHWIFPTERYTRESIGIQEKKRRPISSYAHLPEEEIASRISCELRDHPLLIIPSSQRKSFLASFLDPKLVEKQWNLFPSYLKEGDLCHRCQMISEALLNSFRGDFKKLLMHIQVERFFFSRRYRKGLVTIEPQMHVDAHYLEYPKRLGMLPPPLQALNLFSLSGDLVDANRGILEYADLLKRPLDSFKYLLGACETGWVSIGNSIAAIDTVMVGSTNEIQLDAFKEFSDFSSFQPRMRFIRVPYLLCVSEETKIYDAQLPLGEKHIAPHAFWTVGLWSVLTRLKKPEAKNYPSEVAGLIANLSALEKSQLYDLGDIPAPLAPEDRKLLKAQIQALQEEYFNVPYYEGRTGASAREMKRILFDASQNPEFPCLSPWAILQELEAFVKKITEHEFLQEEVKENFHNTTAFMQIVQSQYLQRVDREVKDCIGMYQANPWEGFLKKYILQISYLLKKEKIKNQVTGTFEAPDLNLINEFEKIVQSPESSEKETFRKNTIAQLGAWSLDHPQETVVYSQVFPEFWDKLEKHYFESQKSLFKQMSDVLLVYETYEENPSEGAILVRKTLDAMVAKQGYCHLCAREALVFLLKKKY